jgi:interleukin-1 receptor-associated kinase 1
MNQKPQRVKKFIYDLPHKDHKDIEDMLNMNDAWESLAGEQLQLRVVEIDKLRRYNQQPGTSAAKALLDHLGNRNTTIQDLFLYLHKIELYRGMDILKPYVPEKLHHFIKSGNTLMEPLNYSQHQARPGSGSSYPHLAPIPPRLTPEYYTEQTRSQNITAKQTLEVQDITLNQLPRVEYSPNMNQDIKPPTRAGIASNHLSSLREVERVRHISETTIGSSVNSSTTDGGIPTVSYDELGHACGNWNPANKIGEGGFGQVFKGVWKHQEVAIKTIKKDKYLVNADKEHLNKSIAQCFKEIRFLSRLRSEYIVPIIAHSEANFNGTWEPCIVYQWMPNGSLDDRLQKKGGSRALRWLERYNIAIGTANGIQFLHNHDHSGKQLVHGDIKSANILLDKNMEPKIGDFGLAREVDGGTSKYFVLSTIYGTQFYLPEDFLRSKKLSTKVDTYSFGVILFDLVTGKRPQTKIGKEYLLDIMRESESIPSNLVDVSWPEQADDSHLCKILYNFGKQCTLDRGKKRPEMEDVYQNLKKALKSENKSPTPYELQQRFDSMDKKPARTPYQGFIVSDGANLIDLSNPIASSQDNIPMVVPNKSGLSQHGIPMTVYGENKSTELLSTEMNSFYLPAVLPENQGSAPEKPNSSLCLDYAFIPSVISDSDAMSTTPTPSSSLLPATLDNDLSSSISSCSTFVASEEQPSEDMLERIEQDIDQSADLLANLGF